MMIDSHGRSRTNKTDILSDNTYKFRQLECMKMINDIKNVKLKLLKYEF